MDSVGDVRSRHNNDVPSSREQRCWQFGGWGRSGTQAVFTVFYYTFLILYQVYALLNENKN